MLKLQLSILFSLFIGLIFAQGKKSNESIADCEGAMNIFKSGSYDLQFTGNPGNAMEFLAYPSLSDFNDINTIWVSYIPEFNGTLTLDASVSIDYVQMVIFEEGKSDICTEISNGSAEMKRVIKDKNLLKIGLNENVVAGYLYSLELKAGKKILIGFSTSDKNKSFLKLNFNFAVNPDELTASQKAKEKIVDLRSDEFSPTFQITVRDKETKQPIIATVTVEGAKDMVGTYTGSDLYFNVVRGGKSSIRCDAEGYFFVDQEYYITPNAEGELAIVMDPIAKGKTMQIEEIEFQAGSSEFLQGAEGKLRRLRDFMALNAGITIEIQGHVHAGPGDDGLGSQKLSEARAKRVMIYLINQGIDKSRMTAIGYGGSKPIYPVAKFSYEEQANRRVEILVK
ncbi:MAG: OmpA family protein [Bacteroidota bacterium]